MERGWLGMAEKLMLTVAHFFTFNLSVSMKNTLHLFTTCLAMSATLLLASCDKTNDPGLPSPSVATAQTQPSVVQPDHWRGMNVNLEDAVSTVDFNKISAARFNSVRIVMNVEDTYKWNAINGIDGIIGMMRAASAQGLSIILVLYRPSTMGNYSTYDIPNAVTWWLGKLPALKATGIDFALNLLNEPGSRTPTGGTANTAAHWRDQLNSAFSQLRNTGGFSGPLIFDIPGYGHEVGFVRAEGQNVAPASTAVSFSLHVYPDSFYNGALPQNQADDVNFMNNLQVGLGNQHLIIGEFGDTGGGGQKDSTRVQQFVDHAQASYAHTGALGWAWNQEGNGMNASTNANYKKWLYKTAYYTFL